MSTMVGLLDRDVAFPPSGSAWPWSPRMATCTRPWSVRPGRPRGPHPNCGWLVEVPRLEDPARPGGPRHRLLGQARLPFQHRGQCACHPWRPARRSRVVKGLSNLYVRASGSSTVVRLAAWRLTRTCASTWCRGADDGRTRTVTVIRIVADRVSQPGLAVPRPRHAAPRRRPRRAHHPHRLLGWRLHRVRRLGQPARTARRRCCDLLRALGLLVVAAVAGPRARRSAGAAASAVTSGSDCCASSRSTS